MCASNKTLLDLNDDCLMEIFQYLTVPETFSLIELHPRFENVGCKRVAKLKHLDINFREPPEFTISQLEIIGSNLRSLYISAGYSMPADMVLQYLQPICLHASHLKTIKLHYFQFNADCQKCLISVASNVENLNLNYCQLNDELLAPILTNCTNLKTLSLLGNYTLKCESLKCLNSKNLKEVQLEQNDFCKESIQAFVVEHPHVKVIIFNQGRLNFQVYGPTE